MAAWSIFNVLKIFEDGEQKVLCSNVDHYIVEDSLVVYHDKVQKQLNVYHGGQTITLEEIQQFMEEQGTAVFQWPERLEILDGWPLTGVNKLDKRRLRVLITVKLFQEGMIEKTFGDEYLVREKICIDDVISGKEKIKLTKMPG